MGTLRNIWHFYKSEKYSWRITLIFIVVFVGSMFFDATREGSAISIFKGAITTNTPAAVVLFFFLICLANGLFGFSYTRSKGRFKIEANAMRPSERLPKSDFDELSVEETASDPPNDIPNLGSDESGAKS